MTRTFVQRGCPETAPVAAESFEGEMGGNAPAARKWPSADLPAYDAVRCAACGLSKPDVMLTRDPRTDEGALVDLCSGCASALRRPVRQVRTLRTELKSLAKRWATGDDDYGMAARLLRDTGLPLDTRWGLFKELVSVVCTDDVRAGRILGELAGSRAKAREAVLSIAQRHWEGETSLNEVLDEIAPYSQLAFPERTLRLGELISELAYEELVEDDRVQPGPGEDRQSLREAAERMVTEAVDALVGSAPSSPGCLPPAAEATTGGDTR